MLATVQRKSAKDFLDWLSRVDWSDLKHQTQNGNIYNEMIVRAGMFATNIDQDPIRVRTISSIITDYQHSVANKETFRAGFQERRILTYFNILLQFGSAQLLVPEVLYNLPPEMYGGRKRPETSDLKD